MTLRSFFTFLINNLSVTSDAYVKTVCLCNLVFAYVAKTAANISCISKEKTAGAFRQTFLFLRRERSARASVVSGCDRSSPESPTPRASGSSGSAPVRLPGRSTARERMSRADLLDGASVAALSTPSAPTAVASAAGAGAPRTARHLPNNPTHIFCLLKVSAECRVRGVPSWGITPLAKLFMFLWDVLL